MPCKPGCAHCYKAGSPGACVCMACRLADAASMAAVLGSDSSTSAVLLAAHPAALHCTPPLWLWCFLKLAHPSKQDAC
jgi:hypothetical protein